MRFTVEVLDAFLTMQATTTDDAWWAAHAILHRGLGLPPWEWPAFEYPDAKCPYPADSNAAKWWHQRRAGRPQAFALYQELKAALQRP